MAIDNGALIGCCFQLQVTKLAPKAWISSAKLWMDPFFRMFNHLIVVGPKLEGNTLRIILRISSHKGEMTYAPYQVHLAIVRGEQQASEVSQHLDALYFLGKR